jgi:hypothetical protein
MYCFFLTDSILGVEILMVIVKGKILPGLSCAKDISMQRGIFLWRGSQVSWRYLKNDQKLN